MIRFLLNNDPVQTDLPAGMTLLDYIRYHRLLNGTKCGCREGDCGACTVLIGEPNGEDHVRYRSMTSCLTPLANVQGKHVVTVEGINPAGEKKLTPVQHALVEESGTQCGFCTVGFVMSLTGVCLQETAVDDTQVLSAIDGNICRCTGYKSIERAANRLTETLQKRGQENPLQFAMQQGMVPDYFAAVPAQLTALNAGKFNGSQPEKSQFVGGGTDLYVQKHEEMVHAPVQPLFNHAPLRGVDRNGDFIEIKGATTVTDLLESPVLQAVFPNLRRHLKLVSSTPIRNMATVAGNLVNASPIGDLTIWLLALDASVVLANGSRREVPLRDFYLGYKSLDKTADEVLEMVRFRQPTATDHFNFEKVSKRTYLDIASVNSAALFRLQEGHIAEAHIATGGVAPVPFYLKNTSAFLAGKPWPVSPDLENPILAEACTLLQSEINPISDVRGSADYKRLLARQLLLAHFMDSNTPL